MALSIPIFYGSVRTEREGIRAAHFFLKQCLSRGHAPVLIDPLEYRFPLLDYMYKEYTDINPPEKMEELAQIIRGADAFIIVSGEYNHSIPPALTNMMDHFLEEYAFRPAGIVSYSSGRFGGVRAAVQLRSYLAELGMVTISSQYPVPEVQDKFTEEGVPTASFPKAEKYADSFLDELEWYACGIRDNKRRKPY
ncbi:MAG: NADPH-dependent FMN reductase [Spirochaetia bacterium]